MKKAILDTNVIVSGIFWRGKPNWLLERVIALRVDIAASPNMLTEYVDVIAKIARKRGEERLVELWNEKLFGHIRLVESPSVFKGCRDVKDNMFIDCALASGTTLIVSGDDDLLSLRGQVKDINIITVEEAIAKLK